ncbi:uncharacterized protein HD556DRAFT_1302581 [Suillus plorans]|uniref:Uncharacterized protein n=1 Tax=Suillus plorans TaxID=116603 RepID=A0A9P7E3K9_9AGAM|nr:uncharacterized protein HD556DRAFT_1302581 [Suillus plorans]KAG1810236.1 hypothetical protein HD556DRAFT_1302581 [Suillus plorans]
METKSSEDPHRLEVEESKEEELAELCPPSSQLHMELGVLREHALDKESKLVTDLDVMRLQHKYLDPAHSLTRLEGTDVEGRGSGKSQEWTNQHYRHCDFTSRAREVFLIPPSRLGEIIIPGDTWWLDTCELLACSTSIGEQTSVPFIHTPASSVPTDFWGVLEPEDVDVDDLIDADVSAETFVWLDNDDLREDLDEPSTLQLGTSTTPTLDLADAPCTPYALTGHRKNTSTSFYAEGVSVSKAVFRLTSFRQNQLEAINATLWNRICIWDIRYWRQRIGMKRSGVVDIKLNRDHLHTGCPICLVTASWVSNDSAIPNRHVTRPPGPLYSNYERATQHDVDAIDGISCLIDVDITDLQRKEERLSTDLTLGKPSVLIIQPMRPVISPELVATVTSNIIHLLMMLVMYGMSASVKSTTACLFPRNTDPSGRYAGLVIQYNLQQTKVESPSDLGQSRSRHPPGGIQDEAGNRRHCNGKQCQLQL